MAKKAENSSLDEEYLRSLMAGGTRLDPQPPPAEIPAGEAVRDDAAAGKRMPKERVGSFAQRFLTAYRPAERQGVYIDRELHTKISAIVGIVGPRSLTVGNYVDNVLKHHFEQFGDEIKAVCSKQFNKIL